MAITQINYDVTGLTALNFSVYGRCDVTNVIRLRSVVVVDIAINQIVGILRPVHRRILFNIEAVIYQDLSAFIFSH